jgi:hypothetical protein
LVNTCKPAKPKISNRASTRSSSAADAGRAAAIKRSAVRKLGQAKEFDTEFGVVTGYLAELRGRGVDLHLMRE